MATVLGGDEVNALVLDSGSYVCRAGYAGDDIPKATFPSAAGVIAAPSEANGVEKAADGGLKRQIKVGSTDINFWREGMEIASAMSSDDIITDWDIAENLWAYAFTDRLRVKPEEYAVMMAEPSHNTRAAREKTAELMFEKFRCPALYLAKNAMLASFAVGRQTSLVIDSGHNSTTVCAVHDGYVLQKSMGRTPVAGRLLTQCMLSMLASKNITVRPRYLLKKVEHKPGEFHVEPMERPGTASSFAAHHRELVAADLKEVVARVSDAPLVEADMANVPTVTYELPDGQEIQVGLDRFKVPELMFNPQLVSSYSGVACPNVDQLMGLPGLAVSCVNKNDVDIRRDLYNGVVFTGGTSLITGLKERLEREMIDAAPQGAKVKVVSANNAMERKFSVWIGGSILSSLGSFQQMWMSKKEYEEHGAGLVHRKCP